MWNNLNIEVTVMDYNPMNRIRICVHADRNGGEKKALLHGRIPSSKSRMTGNHILQCNWPERFKNIEVHNDRERLEMFQIKGD